MSDERTYYMTPPAPANGSPAMPDAFDRALASLKDLPDVTRTKPATVRTIPPLGIGGTQLFVVQTVRQREQGDTIFLEVVGAGVVRLVIPPKVADAIARQRDALASKTRSKAAKARAEADRAAGIQPGFLRGGRTRK